MSSDETLRGPDGKWLKGTPPPNPNGRPPRKTEEEVRLILSERWTPEKLADVADVLYSFAMAGNISAITTILHYMAGKPTDHVAITSEDSLKIALHLPQSSLEDKQDLPQLEEGDADAS